jgi:phosphoglycolate phosphatase
MAIRLVIFDLDGTLIDSRQDLADSVNALLMELGAQPLPLDAVTAMVGEGAAVLVRRALTASGLPEDTPRALERFLAHYDQRLTAHTRPYNGITEALDELRSHGLALALLTNKPQRATMTILERLGLARWFFQVIGGDTAAGRKPDPAGLLSIARLAKAAPFETLMVGDSVTDLLTAHRADSAICLARYGFGLNLDGVAMRGDEAFVNDPGELPAVVRSFHEGTPASPAPGTSQSRT